MMLSKSGRSAFRGIPRPIRGGASTATRSLSARGSTSTSSSSPSSPSSSSSSPSTWKRSRPFELPPWVQPRKTQGTIHFLGPTLDGLPAFLNFRKGLEHLTNIGASHKKVVDVTDLRDFAPRTTLGVEGVEWVRSPSCLSEDRLLADDRGQIEAFVRGPYFAECAAIVQERTGAAKVVPYHYRHRRLDQNTDLHDPFNFSTKPLPNFHMDNDAETAEVNLRRVLGEEEATRWLSATDHDRKKSWAIINLWRPVGDVVRQWPLALVDARDIVTGRDTAPIYTLANYKSHFTALKHGPGEHLQFYYVSDLAPDEAILFVDFDSRCQRLGEERDGGVGVLDTPVGTAHGTFHDHNAPERCPRRRSIEVRSLVLYEN